jgi:hypothetical protein
MAKDSYVEETENWIEQNKLRACDCKLNIDLFKDQIRIFALLINNYEQLIVLEQQQMELIHKGTSAAQADLQKYLEQKKP